MNQCQRHQQLSSNSGTIHRRTMLGGLAAGTLVGCGRRHNLVDPRWPSNQIEANLLPSQASISALEDQPGMPGPYPGRVIEVQHSGSVTDGQRNRAAVKMMIQRGMQQLVPESETAVDAWRSFFQLGDRVGIKVVPVGMVAKPGADTSVLGPVVDLRRPGPISSYEVVTEVVESLVAAGVRRNDILVFERFRIGFIRAGYTAMLPEGVHWECSSATGYDAAQLELDGQIRGSATAAQRLGLRSRRLPGTGFLPRRIDPRSPRRSSLPITSLENRHPKGRQNHLDTRPQGPSIGRGHFGAEEYVTRSGQ